jgi:hypothetical protein
MNEEERIIRNKYIVEKEGVLGCSAAWLDDFLPENTKKRAALILRVTVQLRDSKI